MIDEEDLKEMETAFEEGLEWDGMWTADLLAEVKRLREEVAYWKETAGMLAHAHQSVY
tara:strand:- start:211 stop:384 length:174 start_codon:yes stop_codon:yes gene_type:complete